ncbi:MAG: DoxX family protein [Bradymonadaceae bacterium]
MLSEEASKVGRDIGLLLLRVVFGVLMIVGHGYGKWTSLPEKAASFPDPVGLGSELSMYLAVGAEFFCAGLVVVGLATRAAVIPLIVTMSVAAFVVHGGDPLGDRETALLYGTAFATLLVAGPGRISLDGVIAFLRRAR